MTFKITIYSIFLSLLGFVTSCSSDDDHVVQPEHEHEEVSKIVLHFTNINKPSEIIEIPYEVPEGSTQYPLAKINLPAGSYNVEAHLFAHENDQYHEITEEIFKHDADDHFIFYQILNGKGLTIDYTNNDYVDTAGNKLGYNTVWTVTDEANNLPVYLYLLHQPANKKQDAVSLQELGGNIDLEAHYQLN